MSRSLSCFFVSSADTRDANLKIANVGNLAGRGCTDEQLRAEIAKCDVVCANCHRMRMYSGSHEN